jgi:hypothetical protein
MRFGCSANCMLTSAAASMADSVRCLRTTDVKALVYAMGSNNGCGSWLKGSLAAADRAMLRLPADLVDGDGRVAAAYGATSWC